VKDRFAYVITERGRSEFVYRGITYRHGPEQIQLKQPGCWPCTAPCAPRNGSGSRVVREQPAIRRARAYLVERLAENVRLDDLAEHVGLDKYHLVRAFRAHVGVAPYQSLTHLRIARARELLRKGMRAGDVAVAVGYCDQASFTATSCASSA
jgi:AraC-like DNA-binding protein